MADQQGDSGGMYRVALDLMAKIVHAEHPNGVAAPEARAYYITLYLQCRAAVLNGRDYKDR